MGKLADEYWADTVAAPSSHDDGAIQMSGTGQPTPANDRAALARWYAEAAARHLADMADCIAIGDNYGAAAHRQFADACARLALTTT